MRRREPDTRVPAGFRVPVGIIRIPVSLCLHNISTKPLKTNTLAHPEVSAVASRRKGLPAGDDLARIPAENPKARAQSESETDGDSSSDSEGSVASLSDSSSSKASQEQGGDNIAGFRAIIVLLRVYLSSRVCSDADLGPLLSAGVF